MTFPEFDKFFDAFVDECRSMRDSKGKEYAHSESRFANFDRLADRLGIPCTVVAEVYLTKHMDAIESYISKGRTYSTETIRGRIIDAVTYLILIAGMIQEESEMNKGIEDVMITSKVPICPKCPECGGESYNQVDLTVPYVTCTTCGYTYRFNPRPVFTPYTA